MRIFLALVAVVAILTFAGWWQVFRWQECRQVGHSVLYCVMDHGR